MAMDLSSPFTFRCGLSAKNRAVLAPLTNTQSPGSLLSEEEFAWLAARIRGGFGVVTSCATHVIETGQAWDGELGIFSDEHKAGWMRLAALGRAENCLVIPQLFHGGFRCPSHLTGQQPVSASVFQIEAPDFETPRALREDEILDIKEHFVAAARRAVDSDLPGVEIHGANGYLFTQFLSPFTNRRADRWGGSLENRARFLIETARDVRRAIGPDRVLGIRLSPENTQLIRDIDIDEMKDIARELSRLGADYISVSLGDARKQSLKYGAARPPILRQFREALPAETALTISGNIWTIGEAREILDLGADLLAIGAAGIANPDWPVLVARSPEKLKRPPLTPGELHARAVSDRFIKYLERRSFVAK